MLSSLSAVDIVDGVVQANCFADGSVRGEVGSRWVDLEPVTLAGDPERWGSRAVILVILVAFVYSLALGVAGALGNLDRDRTPDWHDHCLFVSTLTKSVSTGEARGGQCNTERLLVPVVNNHVAAGDVGTLLQDLEGVCDVPMLIEDDGVFELENGPVAVGDAWVCFAQDRCLLTPVNGMFARCLDAGGRASTPGPGHDGFRDAL